jgi:hypothetical protein
MVRDAEARNPCRVLDELIAGLARTEGGKQVQRDPEREQRENEGRAPGGALFGLQEHEQCAQQRAEDKRGQPAHQLTITR